MSDERWPALTWLLADEQHGRELDGTPFECCICPFATVSPDREPPNPDDPGEGYYDCALLDRKAIWGENPECAAADWRKRARTEIDRAQRQRAFLDVEQLRHGG
jgi:hypothetical protein